MSHKKATNDMSTFRKTVNYSGAYQTRQPQKRQNSNDHQQTKRRDTNIKLTQSQRPLTGSQASSYFRDSPSEEDDRSPFPSDNTDGRVMELSQVKHRVGDVKRAPGSKVSNNRNNATNITGAKNDNSHSTSSRSNIVHNSNQSASTNSGTKTAVGRIVADGKNSTRSISKRSNEVNNAPSLSKKNKSIDHNGTNNACKTASLSNGSFSKIGDNDDPTFHDQPTSDNADSISRMRTDKNVATSDNFRTPNIIARNINLSSSICNSGMNSVSEVTTESLHARLEIVETELARVVQLLDKHDVSFSGQGYVSRRGMNLTIYDVNIIRQIVIQELFKSVKFLDDNVVLRVGKELVRRYLIKSSQDLEKVNDQSLFNAVIARARKFLNTYKCHVKSKIRTASAKLLKVTDGKTNIHELWFLYIHYFRVGNYSESPKQVQEAWLQFCHKILVFVNKKWMCKITQSHKFVSDVCTVSDEAFAFQIGDTNMCQWVFHIIDKVKETVEVKVLPDNVTPFKYGDYADNGDDDHCEEGSDNEEDGFDEEENSNEDNELGDEENIEEQQSQDLLHKGHNQKRRAVTTIEDVTGRPESLSDRVCQKGFGRMFDKLFAIKETKHEEWLTWDQAYKDYVVARERNVPGEVSINASRQQVHSDEEDVQEESCAMVIEPW